MDISINNSIGIIYQITETDKIKIISIHDWTDPIASPVSGLS